MKRGGFMRVLLTGFLLAASGVAQEKGVPATRIRFRAVDVFVDSNARPLAAYQLEVSVASGDARITGLEGGEHAAFRQPPFYDPAAIQHERVILAAFNTAAADNLPSGRTRVATLHFQVKGEPPPQYTVKLTTAATVDGEKISGSASVTERTGL